MTIPSYITGSRSKLIGFRNYVPIPCLFEYTPPIIISDDVLRYIRQSCPFRIDELTITKPNNN